MIADLFEPHQRRKDDPTPRDALGILELFLERFDRLRIERRLTRGQATPGPHLGLIRQIGDHTPV